MDYINITNIKKLEDIVNVLYYEHQLLDTDYQKEVIIPMTDADPLVAWSSKLGVGKLKINIDSILLLAVDLYYPHSEDSQFIMQSWKKDCIDMISGIYGFDNILAATYHPYQTPHMHVAVIPLNEE